MNATRMLTAVLIAVTAAGFTRAADEKVLDALSGEMLPKATPTELLTVPPGTGNYPPGTYASPWCGNGCAGPLGGNGPLTYEVYSIVGPSLVVGGSELSSALKTGLTTGGGARSLWFTADQTAAWVFDLGVTYTYNEGQQDKFVNVGTPRVSPIVVDPFTGQTTGGERVFPDGIATYRIRNMNRTTFNFALGRDWWLRGPGTTQMMEGDNVRIGADVGGRWGTSSVNLVPVLDPSNFLKGGSTIHALFIGTHVDWEKPMGAWILTYGVRCSWSYNFKNAIAPNGGDIHDINLLFTVGARF